MLMDAVNSVYLLLLSWAWTVRLPQPELGVSLFA